MSGLKKLACLAGIFIFVCAINPALAGGWTSGGGRIVENGSNPWFIQNTEKVEYCILIDSSQFFVPRKRVSVLIKKAFSYWKSEFKGLSRTVIGGVKLEIASQNFEEVSCGSDTDIVFQFGFLTAGQRANILNPEKVIGLAVRTSYDPKTLKGKGFIYISPESTPSRFVSPDALERPWSYKDNGLLLGALLHETGHVFGIKDKYENNYAIMSANLLSNMVTNRDAHFTEPRFSKMKLHNSILFREEVWDDKVCYVSSDPIVSKPANENAFAKIQGDTNGSFVPLYVRFFGAPKGNGCLIKTIDPNFNLKIYFEKSESNPRHLVGTAKLKDLNDYNYQSTIVQLWMSPEQEVFNFQVDPKYFINRYTPIISRQNWRVFNGEYKTSDGKISRAVTVKVAPEGLKVVGGYFNGQIHDDVVASAPH